jgi:hypothetical protein
VYLILNIALRTCKGEWRYTSMDCCERKAFVSQCEAKSNHALRSSAFDGHYFVYVLAVLTPVLIGEAVG